MFGCCTTDCGASEPIGLPAETRAEAEGLKEAEMLAQVRASKQEPRAEPPDAGAPSVERVTLTRSTGQEAWGFEIEVVSALEAVLVTRVAEGPAQEFNKAAAAGAYQFQKFDFIIGMNGQKGLGAVAVFQSDTKCLDLIVARPTTETVVLRKEEGPLGLQLKHPEHGMTVTIHGVIETGSVAKSGANVRKNDVIIASDGNMGTGKELLKAIQSAECPELTLLRIDPAAFAAAESR